MQSQKLAAIGQLSSGIAHEINNPIAIIDQEAEWMSMILHENTVGHSDRNKELEDSLHQIRLQVNRCKEVTHRLLSFARKGIAVFQKTDVNDLLEDMAVLVEKEASLNNIKIIRKYAPVILPIETDPPLFRQVILNLLNNAVQAVGKNGAITIKTRMDVSEGVEIRISDNGCGIPVQNMDKIFNPFFTTKPPGKGTGLGLSISISIIDRLNGSISVSSEKGNGAEFIIRMPASHKGGKHVR